MTDTKTSTAKRNCDGQPSLAPATLLGGVKIVKAWRRITPWMPWHRDWKVWWPYIELSDGSVWRRHIKYCIEPGETPSLLADDVRLFRRWWNKGKSKPRRWWEKKSGTGLWFMVKQPNEKS